MVEYPTPFRMGEKNVLFVFTSPGMPQPCLRYRMHGGAYDSGFLLKNRQGSKWGRLSP